MEFILRFTFTNLDLDMTSSERSTPAHLQINLDILQRWPLPPDLYALSSKSQTNLTNLRKSQNRLAAVGSAPQA